MAQPRTTKRHFVSSRIDGALHRRLVREARRQERSESEILRRALRDYLDARRNGGQS